MHSRTTVLLLGLALFYCLSVQAQTLETMPCNTDFVASPSTQRGGRYITAQGALNVLFVYVQFPDNDYAPTNPNWPKGGAPSYSNQTVDQVWSPTPTPGGFTDYFNQMSFSALRITGRSDTITTPHTRAWYLQNNWRRPAIQKEILQELDARIDFSEFDHWRFNSEYNLTNTPDHVVDMIFMMWRDIASDLPNWQQVQSQLDLVPGGEASLGYGNQFTVDNGVDTIRMGYSGNGSGVTVIFGRNSGLDAWTIWSTARHEFGHWLLGGNEYHTQLGTWGLLSGFGAPSGCINSFERERLAWINFNTIDSISTPRTITNATLPDFVATGIAYRIKIPGGGTDEWYLLENHQRTSVFDIPDNNVPTAKGLFVLRQGASTGSTVGVISAQGRFTWTVPYQLPNIYGSNPPNLPVFQREGPSRVSGYTKRQNVLWTWQGVPQPAAAIHYHLDYVTGLLHQAPPTIYTGDGQDQFDINYNTVFSPASNPSTNIYANANKVGFEITSMANGVCTMNIHINTVEAASPSKPALGLNPGDLPCYYGWICLAWGADFWDGLPIESDVSWSELQRKIGTGPWVTVYAGPYRTWSDGSITYDPNGSTPVYFRVRVRDTQNKWSVWSELFNTKMMDIAWQEKAFHGNIPDETPSTFELSQNYPNPFNPTTTIKYQLPEDGFVNLKVFNVLGQEVAALVSGGVSAGYHSASFDANGLSSGVYFARLTASNSLGRVVFTKTMKLLLAR